MFSSRYAIMERKLKEKSCQILFLAANREHGVKIKNCALRKSLREPDEGLLAVDGLHNVFDCR